MPPLHQLILTVLASSNAPISRYEIMQRVNEIVSIVEPPYSPGSIYHAAKLLGDKNWIKIDHDYVSLMQTGHQELNKALLAPLPDLSIVTILYRALCIGHSQDAEVRSKGKKLLQIEMINVNQFIEKSTNLSDNSKLALNTCRKELSVALQRILLNIGA